MVRPNQIIESDVENKQLTFIMFARSEEQVKRRVLFLNFPGKAIRSGLDTSPITNVEVVSKGMVNRYAVTADLSSL